MGLREDLIANVPQELLNTRDEAAIAAHFNTVVPRTKLVETAIGPGTILAKLGIDTANALIDVIYNVTQFRHVKPLLENSKLDLSVQLLRDTLDNLAASATIPGFGAAQAKLLKDLAVQPDPITALDVAKALEG